MVKMQMVCCIKMHSRILNYCKRVNICKDQGSCQHGCDECSCTHQFGATGACTRQFSGLILHSDFFVLYFLLTAKSHACQLKSLTVILLFVQFFLLMAKSCTRQLKSLTRALVSDVFLCIFHQVFKKDWFPGPLELALNGVTK